jgi:hypothetical protein
LYRWCGQIKSCFFQRKASVSFVQLHFCFSQRLTFT